MRDRIDLFLASVLVLFLELACIRWFPAHVLFLTFFTNVMLLASFLGISVGCLAASRRADYLWRTPVLLALALGAAHLIEWQRLRTGSAIDVGNHVSPQLVFFGVESQPWDPSKFVIPIEAVSGAVFVLVALTLVGPGQQLGRSLSRFTNRLEAYTINVAGSIAGILLFTASSRWQLGPVWWFAGVLALMAWFLARSGFTKPGAATAAAGAAAVLVLASSPGTLAAVKPAGFDAPRGATSEIWSPYYRVNYEPDLKRISVNLIGHQQMISRGSPFPAYALPHLWNRDSGERPFSQVLIVGAGSGNDVSRAIEWGAQRVDAVEIDPAIHRLGERDHPDRPYSDPRVFVHLDDGRNFLRSTNKQYDLIVYALVDSLVLHSSYSNIRLESYLFTAEAFADIKKRLAPGGVFVMYNYFRQGWIVARLNAMLEETFGAGNPLVFNLPPKRIVKPDDLLFDEFTMMVAGDTAPLKGAFASHPEYWVRIDEPTNPSTPNGFDLSDARARSAWEAARSSRSGGRNWMAFSPTTLVPPEEALRLPTDAWPFLYLRGPMIPALSLRGAAVMAVAGAFFLGPFLRRRDGAERRPRFLALMFFLGAGFMLIETKAVVQMALLFGSTWTVNSVVFCAVLSMILAANAFVLIARPRSLAPFYAGLLASLAVSAVVPLDAFLGLSREAQVAGACLLAFTPVAFAGVIFALSFREAPDPDRAFGANIAGAMAGGLSEYSSMLLGFQYVVLVAMMFYALSAWMARRDEPVLPDS
jgi:SAM-dependent methyltransferase